MGSRGDFARHNLKIFSFRNRKIDIDSKNILIVGEQDSAVILLYDPADVPRPYPVFFAPVPFAGQKISVLFFHLIFIAVADFKKKHPVHTPDGKANKRVG